MFCAVQQCNKMCVRLDDSMLTPSHCTLLPFDQILQTI